MPLPERAIAFFMYHYDLESPSQNKTDDMGVILLKSDEAWEHYRLAFEACAMASFINETGGQLEYKSLTIETYNKALMAMHSALQDPDVVYEDATLAAVLLLALFECLNPTTGEQESWRNHVQGAIELARGRGHKQTDTRIGHMLFRATRTLMVIYSLATLEDEKDKELWWSEDDEYTSTQQLYVGVASLGAEATALLGPSGRREVVEVMLKRCQAHDRACKARWEELLKSTQGISSNNTDPWLLMLLNMLTCARILLNSIILKCATWIYKVPNYQTSEEYDGACSALAEIILHSAKVNEQQLCWAGEAQSSFAELDVQLQPGRDSSGCAINKWIEDNRDLRKEKPLVGLQPLALIWSLKCLTDDQKIAVDTRLQRIVGIRGALPLHDDRASTVEQIPHSPSYTTEACTRPSPSLSEPATDTPEASSRDSSPPSTGRFRYTQEDDDTLLELYKDGISWRDSQASPGTSLSMAQTD
ncbi:putative negative acting factor [Metarhizium acridum CQMa 102]|uniref:Putative negative acting factor n=1 Tax=Metarhizium acridum (strain CQMa 102) TaxID=655827 RepID=E9E023_METAQ|nr:putative negative acting factor [Metarhizium acridum CQMa 102]EFY90719.1 putative negative acting factor [Metarhizium acridum CQMa 102]